MDDADWEADLATWHRECQLSRDNAARFNLDATGLRRGEEVSLRWVYTHMVEEYARHNGHADLIREMIDGAVGCQEPLRSGSSNRSLKGWEFLVASGGAIPALRP